MGSYIPSTEEERARMLKTVGMGSPDELFSCIPPEARIHDLNLPDGLTEMEVSARMASLAGENRVFASVFRGAGAYRHYIPSIVTTVTTKEEFVTAYTPYQAEISQGVLQSIFEYQTQICELTGMEVSNASVYDGAVAAAESVLMNVDGRRKKKVLISEAVNPDVLTVVQTYCESRNVPLTVIPMKNHATDPEALRKLLDSECASVCFQQPNYFGILEDAETLIGITHEAGAKAVMNVNPISLGLLKTPGEYGADIACGEGQPLGLPLSFGGPYLGFMATTKELMRKLPGRIVGQTEDTQGRRAYVLTLQAREQHIRREKASSNICSNEALCAMTASVYLAAVGPEGLRRVALNSVSHAHYLAARLSEIEGFALVEDSEFFHEFLMTCPIDPIILNEKLAEQGILGGLPIEGGILWCATELNGKKEIDRLVDLVKEAVR